MDEQYHVLIVRPSSHYDLFSDFLADTLPVGFEETDDAFIIRSEDELDTIAWGVEQFAEALQKALGEPVEVELELKKENTRDWIEQYREHIAPVEVGSFYVHPTWESPKEGAINIALDPALAFGTGHHPTTASCLKAVASHVTSKDEVLDVGCGSGILAIAALKLGAVVDACDTDSVSIENAKLNAEENGVSYRNLWEGSVSLTKEKYDVVIANIVADVLTFIARDLKRALKPSGKLILSGIMDKYEEKVLRSYSDCRLVERIQEEEWITLILETNKGEGE